jgi:hypothetical protein
LLSFGLYLLVIDAKDLFLEETQSPQIVLLLDDEPIGMSNDNLRANRD